MSERSEERVHEDKVEEEILIGQSPSASAPVRPNTEDRVFITSKLAPNEMGERHAAVALESIHARLNTPAQTKEPLDLALIHWPGKSKTPPTSPANLAARRETWKFLEQSLEQTDVRAIGVSNYTSAHLAEMKAYARVMPAVNQVEFHPRCQQRELRKTCESMGIGLVAYSPLGCGELLTDERVLRCAKALGEAIGGTVSPARALIAWSLRQDGVVAVVVKSSDGERIGEFILFFMRAIRLTLLLFFLQPRTWVPRVSKLRRGWRR
jgi:diketogulonate reductase-like aldo/keto reductase